MQPGATVGVIGAWLPSPPLTNGAPHCAPFTSPLAAPTGLTVADHAPCIDYGDGTVADFSGTEGQKAMVAGRIQRVTLDQFSGGEQIHIQRYGRCDSSDKVIERSLVLPAPDIRRSS